MTDARMQQMLDQLQGKASDTDITIATLLVELIKEVRALRD